MLLITIFVLFLVFHSILFASLAQLVLVHHFPPSLQSANHENSGFLQGKPPVGCDCRKRGGKTRVGSDDQSGLGRSVMVCRKPGFQQTVVRTKRSLGQRRGGSQYPLSQGKHGVYRVCGRLFLQSDSQISCSPCVVGLLSISTREKLEETIVRRTGDVSFYDWIYSLLCVFGVVVVC